MFYSRLRNSFWTCPANFLLHSTRLSWSYLTRPALCGHCSSNGTKARPYLVPVLFFFGGVCTLFGYYRAFPVKLGGAYLQKGLGTVSCAGA